MNNLMLEVSAVLWRPGLVASPQVVDVDNESSFILADHVPDFALVDPLVLLQEKATSLWQLKILIIARKVKDPYTNM